MLKDTTRSRIHLLKQKELENETVKFLEKYYIEFMARNAKSLEKFYHKKASLKYNDHIVKKNRTQIMEYLNDKIFTQGDVDLEDIELKDINIMKCSKSCYFNHNDETEWGIKMQCEGLIRFTTKSGFENFSHEFLLHPHSTKSAYLIEQEVFKYSNPKTIAADTAAAATTTSTTTIASKTQNIPQTMITLNVCTGIVPEMPNAMVIINNLKQKLNLINVKLQEKWTTDCTHLVMPTIIRVTPKLLYSLACGIPIITPAFFDAYVAAVKAKHALPKVDDFIPEISESGESLKNKKKEVLKVNLARKHLFRNKTFVFMTENDSRLLGRATQLAGANKSIDLETNETFDLKNLLKPDYIAVSSEKNVKKSNEIGAYIKNNANGLQLIEWRKISFAIIDCSAIDTSFSSRPKQCSNIDKFIQKQKSMYLKFFFIF